MVAGLLSVVPECSQYVDHTLLYAGVEQRELIKRQFRQHFIVEHLVERLQLAWARAVASARWN